MRFWGKIEKWPFCDLRQLFGFLGYESGRGVKKLEIIPILRKNGFGSILTTLDHFLTYKRITNLERKKNVVLRLLLKTGSKVPKIDFS